MASVGYDDNQFLVRAEFWENDRAKMMPERKWDKKRKVWVALATKSNARYLSREFNDNEIGSDARAKIDELMSIKPPGVGQFPSWFKFKNPPMPHQRKALDKAWGKTEFAFLFEMRCGKTFTDINWTAALAMTGAVNAYLIIVPSSIRSVWEDELDSHCPIPYESFTLEAGARGFDKFLLKEVNGLKVMIMGVEALSQGNGAKYAMQFVATHKCKVTVDESSRIKTHDSNRTEQCIKIGEIAKYRAILTGTVITQGIHDIFPQFYFLNWEIIGMRSFYVFRNRYCVMGGFEGRSIVGYQNVAELMSLVEPYVYQVEAKDVYKDIPPKVYERRFVNPTKQQIAAMRDLKDLMYAEDGDDRIEVATVLERITRYQQIAGGSFPYLDDDSNFAIKELSGGNPKLNEMMVVLDEIPSNAKVIVWARFRPELERIQKALRQHYGNDSVVEFHGGVSDDDKRDAKHRFQNDDSVRFFVSNQSVGGMALELSAASYMVYFSNTFSYEDRRQSEARPMSGKQKNSVCVIDIILDHKVDRMVHEAVKNKTSMAEYVKGHFRNIS